MSTTVESSFSVRTLLSSEEVRERVSRIFEAEAIIHEPVVRLGEVTLDDAVVLYLDPTDQTRADSISSKTFAGRALFLIVPPELEPTACIWWENDFITDFVTTDRLNRLPSAIRRYSARQRLQEYPNPVVPWEGLRRVGKTILEAGDLDGVFTVATEEIGKLLKAQHAVIVQHHEAAGFWRHEAEFRSDPGLEETIGYSIPDADNPFATELKNRRVVQVTDSRNITDSINAAIAERFPGSWLLVPIPVGDSVWGSLSLLGNPGSKLWSEQDISTATMLADNLGIAIKQGKLSDQLKKDFEERNHLYHALREGEIRFRTVVGSSPLAITIKDCLTTF